MTVEEKLRLLEKTIEVEKGSLLSDTLLENVEAYDSMAKLAIIVIMEDEFGVNLKKEDFDRFVTVGDIIGFMQR